MFAFDWEDLKEPFLSGDGESLGRVVSQAVYDKFVLLSLYHLNSKLNPKIFRWEHGQEAFAEFYINWMEHARVRFEPGLGEFRPYFLACLQYSCRRWRTAFFRDRNRQAPFGDDVVDEFERRFASAVGRRPDVRQVVEDALESCTEQQRRAFLLRYLEGFSREETGATMGISAGYVATLCFRARPAVVAALTKAGVIDVE